MLWCFTIIKHLKAKNLKYLVLPKVLYIKAPLHLTLNIYIHAFLLSWIVNIINIIISRQDVQILGIIS